MSAADDRFERLVEAYGSALWRLTGAYANRRHDREDLYQEILVALWSAMPRFRGESSERTFVYRVAHNRGISASLRAARVRMDSLEEAPPPVDRRPGPAEMAERTARRERLREALRRLPLSRRQVVVLRLEGLSHREIAQVVGITENNVAVRLSRARSDLERLLKEEPDVS